MRLPAHDPQCMIEIVSISVILDGWGNVSPSLKPPGRPGSALIVSGVLIVLDARAYQKT